LPLFEVCMSAPTGLPPPDAGPATRICFACGRANRSVARFCGSCGRALGTDAASLAPGALLGGRYRVGRALGEGGFGVAYLAYDTRLQERRCVVKRPRLRLDLTPAQREVVLGSFAREARLLVTLNHPGHPNIPEIYEYLEDERCLVMKFIEGETLRDQLRFRGPLAEEAALACVRDVCAALAYMHSRPAPVLHCDLKPDNILRDGEGRVWVIDFGLARTVAGDVGSGSPGTPGFIAPEQWHGAPEPRSDVYALGATLYALLAGVTPSLHPAPLRTLRPEVRPAVDSLIARTMAADPVDRPDARAVLAELDTLIEAARLPRPPEPQPPPPVDGAVGRRAELEALVVHLRDKQTLVLTGMPGAGASTLAALLARSVGLSPTFWHTCRPGEGIAVIVRRLIEFLAWHGHPAAWQRYLRARQLEGLFPDPLELLDDAGAALRRLQPLVCLDDLHTIGDDPQLPALLERLRHAAVAGPGGLLVTTRPPAPSIGNEAVVAVGGLDPQAARMLLEQIAGPLPAVVADKLCAATGGNAQLLTLAANAARSAGDAAALAERLLERSGIEHYLHGQIDRGLSERERDVMGALAALLGDEADEALIEELLDGAPVRRALITLRDRHLLERRLTVGGPVFGQHPLVRDFYYGALGRQQRRALHSRAADHTLRAGGDTLRAAEHLFGAGEPGAAIDLVARDVRHHLSHGRVRAVAMLLARIVPGELGPAETLRLHLARGAVAAQLREVAAARTAYDAAAALAAEMDDPARRGYDAQVALGMGELLEAASPREAIRWLERGLALLDAATSPADQARLRLRLASAHTALGAYEAARAEIDGALTLLPEDSRTLRAYALNNLGILLAAQGDREAGVAAFRDALAIQQTLGNAWDALSLQQNIALELDIGGWWDEALAMYEEASATAARLGHVAREADLANNLACLKMNRGDWDEARAAVGHSIALADRYELRETLLYAQSTRADLALRMGAWDEAAAALAAAETLAGELDTPLQLPEVYSGRALLELAAGRLEPALDAARRACALAEEQEHGLAEGVGRRVLGLVLLARGERQTAIEALEQSAGLLADEPYELARTGAALGRALIADGPDRAHSLLVEARQTFARLGAWRDMEAVASLLAPEPGSSDG
jgi:tRNA A-37 threonylcarbamoyl transferase component Bud32/tetratricopeptide (TPR) repeat protein